MTPTTDYAAQLYHQNPQAERQAVSRLTQMARAVREGEYEDPEFQMPQAAGRLAEAEFTATRNYAELLQHHADHSGNPEWDRAAEDAMTDTADRARAFTALICDTQLDLTQTVSRLHRLCREDFNQRMTLITACPEIYRASRISG